MTADAPVWLWAVVSAAILAVVVAVRVRPWRESDEEEPSLAWFFAGSGSATMLVLTVVKLLQSLPPASALPVGWMALAGLVTGWFLGVGLTPRERQSA